MAEYARAQLQASIIPVLHRRTYLEKHKMDIVDYAKEFFNENNKHGKVITRHDIEWYWEANIRAEYDTLNPSHNQLVSQTSCPKFQIFWMQKIAVAALQEKELLHQQEGFWLLKPSSKQRKHLKGALILGNDTERWIVPDVALMAIGDVFFNTFVQNIKTANASQIDDNLDDSKLFRLWGALVKKAYDFVPKEVQIEKLKEVGSNPLINHCKYNVEL